MIDTLKLARRLEAANLPKEQAEALADGLAEALHEDTITKADLKVAVTELRGEIQVACSKLKVELIIWMVGLMMAQTGLLWAVLHK